MRQAYFPEPIQTRHSLLRRLKNLDDQASWEDFFRIYWKFIYGVAIKAGLRESEAQDVVQETILILARNIKAFEVGSERGSFKGWLWQTTRWRIADQFRKRSALALHEQITPAVEKVADPASLEPDSAWEDQWQQNLMDSALANLKMQVDPSQYQMFDLHVLKGWTANEVAQKLGVPMRSVYFAKLKLSRLLKREIQRLEAKLI